MKEKLAWDEQLQERDKSEQMMIQMVGFEWNNLRQMKFNFQI